MKFALFAAIAIALHFNLQFPADCKNQGGVYKTYQDFKQDKLSNVVCLELSANRIYKSPTDKIVIKSDATTVKYKSGEIFAYFDGSKLYRFHDRIRGEASKGYFQIVDSSGLILYSRKSRSYNHTVTRYYYSKTMESSVRKINLKNMGNDFPDSLFLKEIAEAVDQLQIKDNKDRSAELIKINRSFKERFIDVRNPIK